MYLGHFRNSGNFYWQLYLSFGNYRYHVLSARYGTWLNIWYINPSWKVAVIIMVQGWGNGWGGKEIYWRWHRESMWKEPRCTAPLVWCCVITQEFAHLQDKNKLREVNNLFGRVLYSLWTDFTAQLFIYSEETEAQGRQVSWFWVPLKPGFRYRFS